MDVDRALGPNQPQTLTGIETGRSHQVVTFIGWPNQPQTLTGIETVPRAGGWPGLEVGPAQSTSNPYRD